MMTDNEIIKALEICAEVMARQDKDIEKLTKDNKTLSKNLKHFYACKFCGIDPITEIKTEAIKEFAERLREKGYTNNYCQDIVLVESIDNLVKEMTEAGNDKRRD